MIPSTNRKAGPYVGNSVTTSFPFAFKTLSASDLRIVKNTGGVESTLVLNSDYSVSLNADQEVSPGGAITYPISGSPLASPDTLTILSALDITQTADITNLSAYYPQVVEDALDRSVMLIGQLDEVVDRAAVMPTSVTGFDPTMPVPVASALLGFNSTGTGFAYVVSAGSLTVSSFGNSLMNAANATAGRAVLGATAVGDAVFIAANAAAARTALSLGTAATANTGTASGNVPLLDSAGKMAKDVHERAYQPLSASVNANALTATLAAGARLEFSDGTAFNLTASISVTASNGSTLGTSNGVAARLWVVALKNAGTPELAIINTWNGTDIYELLPHDTVSTTAEGGAGAADSAHVFYSTTARAAQAIDIVGYIEITEATAGVWATAPTLVQGYARNMPRPGDVIQTRRKTHGGGATSYGATACVIDNTIPQNTEGVELTDLAVAITPRSALNLLRSEALLAVRVGVAAQTMIGVFRDATASAVWAFDVQPGSGVFNQSIIAEFLAGTAASTTTKLYIGVNGGANVRLGADAADLAVFGGVSKSIHIVREIMR